MISEAKMNAAADALFDAMLNSMPDEQACDHQFSQRFERKMKRLIRRTEHPVLYRVLRSAAGIALAIMVGFAALLAASPTVRATFFGWLREQYDAFTRYYYAGEESQDADPNSCELTYVPEGYVEWQRSENGSVTFVMYENSQTAQTMFFAYSGNTESLSVFAVSDNCEAKTIQLNGHDADLILPNDSENVPAIVWYEPEKALFCILSADLSEEELIRVAESVR